ncbi:P34 probable thiol protease-like [Neltuma alba]|uniref:P34 probable thiol protease-like n=1 Tax=Neltuma alba TaxID=207710 RepID=UPI0010A448C4|nr:P34 probable thiol protease-like [Prosopis alba]
MPEPCKIRTLDIHHTTSSLATKMLLLFFVWYASICLTSGMSDEYSIRNIGLDKFTFEKEVFHLFQMRKKETQREYQTLEEDVHRFRVFKSNLKYIREKNAERKSPGDYSLGLNKFSDMSYEEFSKIYLHETEESMIESNNSRIVLNAISCPTAPSSFDWRTEGAQIKFMFMDTCWAFSATRAMEGINKIVSGQLLALSEQQLISYDQKSTGCKGGGWYANAFQSVINNNGIVKNSRGST